MLAALRVDRHLAEEERRARVEEVDAREVEPPREAVAHVPGLPDARRREAGARGLAVQRTATCRPNGGKLLLSRRFRMLK